RLAEQYGAASLQKPECPGRSCLLGRPGICIGEAEGSGVAGEPGEFAKDVLLVRAPQEQCLRPVDGRDGVYLPGDRVESQAMTGVGAPAGKVQPDAHRSPWRRLWPRGR